MSDFNKFICRHTYVTQYALRYLVLLVSVCIGAILQAKTEMFPYQAGLDDSSLIYQIGTNHQHPDYPVENLGIPGANEMYFSGVPNPAEWQDNPAFIEVDLKDGGLDYTKAGDNDCLLIYVRRDKDTGFANAHPTAFKVIGLFGDDDEDVADNWHELFYVYLLYRGPETQEFSSKVLIKKLWMNIDDLSKDNVNIDDLTPEVDINKRLKKMRFIVTANNNRERGVLKIYRDMAMARFDVLSRKKDGDGSEYSSSFVDRFHTSDDYVRDYQNFEFINSEGIFAPQNKVNGWEEITAKDKSALNDNGINIEFPDFSMIEPETSPYPLAQGQKRQPTHTVEHIVYAVPGDVVALYPYYEMWNTEYYQENFSHWYNYRTGGRLKYEAPWSKIKYDLLDFAIDPTYSVISDDYGFFGGELLNERSHAYTVSTVEEYISVVNKVNRTARSAYIELLADLDFSGYDNVPRLGDNWLRQFTGFLNGNGHRISNLKINLPDNEGVGLIGYSNKGARIENLTIDSSCEFIGSHRVGLIGLHYDGYLYVRNVRNDATCVGTRKNDQINENGEKIYSEQTAAGILGSTYGNSNRLIFENCYIGGVIGSPDDDIAQRNNAAIVGWAGTVNISDASPDDERNTFRNIVVNCTLYGAENDRKYFRNNQEEEKGHIIINNCYGNLGAKQGFEELPENNTNPFNWTNGIPPMVKPKEDDIQAIKGDRQTGTFATFFCPRNPYSPAGVQHNLPFDAFDAVDEEFIIAADFSQEFSKTKHVDLDNKTITEPLISSRHIFKIRDGKVFAEDFSGSPEKNENFVRKNQRMVSARAGVPFQIRFDTPVPKSGQARSNYYYKIDDDDYRRVCAMDIRVLNALTREPVGNGEIEFKAGEAFKSQGSRFIDNVEYKLGGNGEEYFRMLQCDNPREGNYIVQLIGKDVNGEIIKVYDSGHDSDHDLVVMEYNINFMPASGASMLTEDELYNDEAEVSFKHARVETLEEKYGLPRTSINFDEYIKLNHLSDENLKNKFVSYTKGFKSDNTRGMEGSYFKWPIKWDLSNYSFGYNNRHDYNMYMLASHSSVTPFNEKANQYDGNRKEDGKGLYDRLYYTTKRLNESESATEDNTKVEQGYFYYVNAATDPGVSARLEIKDICNGSTVHVSAWMAEFSNLSETANISFNFVAVLRDSKEGGDASSQTPLPDGFKGGDRVVLHSFITGYVPRDGVTSAGGNNANHCGEWLNIYYSFVPRVSEFSADGITTDMIDHFELELDNNCKSSNGADYAIDDIRVYIANPIVLAEQIAPICEEPKTLVRIESGFDTLIQSFNEQEAKTASQGHDLTFYYTFIDKAAYDKAYEENIDSEDPNKVAFNASVVESSYIGRVDETSSHKYGVMTFNTYYKGNKDYIPTSEPDIKASIRTVDGERMIVFNTDLTVDHLKPGQTYYAILSTTEDPGTEDSETSEKLTDENAHSVFNIKGYCVKFCEFTVKASNVIKIDGVVVEEANQFEICENQSPVIQVNIWGQVDGDFKEIDKNAYFDWFLGTNEEFLSLNDGVETHTLAEALSVFRAKYPTAETTDGITTDDNSGENGEGNGSERLMQWMLDIINKESSPVVDETNPNYNRSYGRLQLHQSSFVVPPARILEGDKWNETIPIVAIPINTSDKDIIICSNPTEIDLTVKKKSPKLQHGLKMPYPEDMADVPLRIGLDQMRTYQAENIDIFDSKVIEIPVRYTGSTNEKADRLTLAVESALMNDDNYASKEGAIVLVQTNDPEYKDLGTVDGKYETGHLLWTGEVINLTAELGEANAEGNLFDVKFDRNFKFKEGYYYRMRFQYQESVNSSADEAADEEEVCNGHDVFTLKIVPKYLLWTGDRNMNWNNDDNWRRVASAELYADGKYGDAGYRHHVTDGKDADATVNNREKSYAPLDFTHVIIPSPVVENNNDNDSSDVIEAPYLYGVTMSNVEVNRGGNTTEYNWPENLETDGSGYADYPENGVGEATSMIQYDMAAYDVTPVSNDDASTACRPWYMNTCKEIHFKPGATIMNQHELDYDKAWVDVELDHSRWYTLASPLKDVFAGDFYLPSDGARQLTELFQDITFDNTLTTTHRFKPAVYQRGWDKSSAKVYEVDGPGVDADGVRNVVIKANWSLVYNDVAERYDGGVGFSIKTDVSHMETNKPGDDGKVLFRFPKADTEYFYFTQDGSQNGHETTVRTQSNHRLNETNGTISASTATEGKYFLIGNPFMTHMDIQKFLKANEGKLEPKYWIVTAKGQIAGSIDDNGKFIATPVPAEEGKTYADPTVIAPMQGFFVEAKATHTLLDLEYDESMMRRYDSNKGILTEATRGDEMPDVFRITSYCEGNPTSAAILVTDIASGNDVAAMDNRDLEIPSTVYTAKNGQVLSINFCEDAEGVEIGVIADADTKTVLRFDGSETIDGLSLLDKADYTLTPIHEGMEITVDGMAAGRYFLTYGARVEEVFGGIEWSKNNDGLEVCDRASSGYLEVKVYDTLGRLMTSAVSDGERIHIALSHGVYVVEMANGNERKSVKISN